LLLSRALSTSSSGGEGKKNTNAKQADATTAKNSKEGGGDPADESTSGELILTPGEIVVASSRIGMWIGIVIFAGCCAYYIGKELFPT
jgi:hypothetical protein